MKPSAPLPTDCCGSGCAPCVFDIYEEDLKKWKKNCKNLSSNASESEEVISCSHYTSFELIAIEVVSPNTNVYRFKLPENKSLAMNIGQHIIIKGSYNNRVITRPYTPINGEITEDFFEILIKLYPQGKMSSVVKDWKIGDKIDMRGPYGSFSYVRNSFKSIVMFAAGTGIAPMFQIIKSILNDDDDMTRILLLYSSKSFKDILLRNELHTLQAYWNFKVCHYLSTERDKNDTKYGEEVEFRRVTKADAEQAIHKETPGNTLVLISGTKSYDKDMTNAALNVSVLPKHIFRF